MKIISKKILNYYLNKVRLSSAYVSRKKKRNLKNSIIIYGALIK